jgi:hypothetical protein
VTNLQRQQAVLVSLFAGRYSKRLEQQRFESRVEKEIERCKPEARQSVLLQCLNLDDSSCPIAIDWQAYDKPFEEQGSMLPLLRHEVDLWLKTVWRLLKPYEERMTLDAFKYALLLRSNADCLFCI